MNGNHTRITHATTVTHTTAAMRMISAARMTFVLLVCLCASTHLARAQRRVAPGRDESSRRSAPPAAVTCDRNNLTVYSGRVIAYRRTRDYTALTIAIDRDTTERVRIRHARERSPHPFYLVDGRPADAADIRRIELRPNALPPDTRVNAWVCADERTNPIVDWQGVGDPSSRHAPRRGETRRASSR